VVQGTAPTWSPGLYWINSASGYSVNEWNGIAWVTAGSRYLALLTADPVAGGVVNVSDAGFLECITPGYARQAVTFTAAATAYPTTSSNAALVTFGPMTATMVLPVQWVALVTGLSGTQGLFLFSWLLAQPVQVQASQYIQISPSTLIINQS
jgi:hypothetical protein